MLRQMGQHSRRESCPCAFTWSSLRVEDLHLHNHHRHRFRAHYGDKDNDLLWPFGKVEGLDESDIRETAYEIFFTSCRSSPGFGGGRNALSFYSNHENGESGSKSNESATAPISKVKRSLGLKMIKRAPAKRLQSLGSSVGMLSALPSSPMAGGSSSSSMSFTSPPKLRRPMTSAEIMRQQMRVTEPSDTRLRKTLMRTLVGQVVRRPETIILPLELLRHLKPSEFNDAHEYHIWQRRQLKVLEAGLLSHPSIPVDKTSTFALRLREIVQAGETNPIDTCKNSDTLRTLCNSVVSLAWRSSNGAPTDVCHWADGQPLNIHLYITLFQAIFDVRDETLVLDEVDELMDLMKKTWPALGMTKPIHNVCFSWVLFQQYITTGQIESDLLCAAHAVLAEVAGDAKIEKDSLYVKILTCVLRSMKGWAEKRLHNYHESFPTGSESQIENFLPLVLTASEILGEDDTDSEEEWVEKEDKTPEDPSAKQIDSYIRSSIKSAFEKRLETMNTKFAESESIEEISAVMLKLAQETEDLAMEERESYSPILGRWHPTAAAVAALMLHNCYGHLLRQSLAEMNSLTSETVEVLQRAAKLEKTMVQMVVEDSVDCEDGGKTLVQEMVPYEVDSMVLDLVKKWIEESLNKVKECIQKAKESETWNPKSKSEPYAQSVVELMKLASIIVEEFFKIPIGISEDVVSDLAEGLASLFKEYSELVASCGSKQNYIPSLPPLTRCNRDSTLQKIWKNVAPCGAGYEELQIVGVGADESHNPRPSTSRGTQRLYIRLNTLHYMLSHIHPIDKALCLTPGILPSSHHLSDSSDQKARTNSTSYFETATSSIQTSCQHVSEVAAYRLVFLDSNSLLYGSLYVGDVANARIRSALRTFKQNFTLMTAILTERAQALAMKEVMKAAFDAFLMVLLAGGVSRVFHRSDHEMLKEDFDSLKKVFCSCLEGLVPEEEVERESEVAEGVIALMDESTEQLMEDFSILTCETSGAGTMGNGHKLPMPPTTGRWNRTDPNTILRVLCHRNDRVANHFLKRSFQLAKRK